MLSIFKSHFAFYQSREKELCVSRPSRKSTAVDRFDLSRTQLINGLELCLAILELFGKINFYECSSVLRLNSGMLPVTKWLTGYPWSINSEL